MTADQPPMKHPKMPAWDDIQPVTDDRLPPVAWDLVQQQHVRRLHPKYWLGAARSLRYSADILFVHEQPYADVVHAVATGKLDRSELVRWPNFAGAQLLYGFAFENLLKGIIHARYPSLRDPALWGVTKEQDEQLRPKRRQQVRWMTHDLSELAKIAKVQIPAPLDRLLWLYESKVKWSARYGTASSAPETVRLDDDGYPDAIESPDPRDHRLVQELFRLLESELITVMPGEPEGPVST